jgi:RimJ/RimL family protein N-acetyltransferase
MNLRPLEGGDVGLVAGWLSAPENARWLSFGPGIEVLSPVSLKVMAARDTHVLRLFTADEAEAPIGIVALSDVDRRCKTATLWYVLGNARYGGRGYASRAVSRLLSEAFSRLGLEAVNAWAVDGNARSIRILERNGFKLVGEQRRCHLIDGIPRSRLLFDLLAAEHQEQA